MEEKKEDEKQEVKTNEIINEEKNEQNNNQINIVNNNNINNKTESENFIDKTILNKYKLIKKIRRGSQAQIYLGENIKTFEQYAIKIEKNKSENCLLKNEIYMLGNLQNNSQKNMGIVEMITCAKYKDYLILVEKLLGKSLEILFLDLSKKFTILDICQIALQCIDRIEYVHSKGIIHCDIKPENFVIGLDDPNVIYLIDFGLGQKYISLKTGKHIEFLFTGYMTGTARYASRNALRGKRLSRRDDIESFMYMILYFLAKKLPWQGLKAKNVGEKYKKIYNYKKEFNYKSFCKNYPKEITKLLEYVYSLAFTEKPLYEYIRESFHKILEQNNLFKKDFFSWMDKKEYEDISSKNRRALSESKNKNNENKKKIKSSIIGNLKESTIAVTNLRLSRIDNTSKLILDDDNDNNSDNEEKIDDINYTDNEKNINNLLSTGTNINHKLEKYPDDEEEKKFELKKELEVIKEEENEDDNDLDIGNKKMGGSVHLYKVDMKEYKFEFKNKDNKNNKEVNKGENNIINVNKKDLTKSNIHFGNEEKEIKEKLIGKKIKEKTNQKYLDKNLENKVIFENNIKQEVEERNNINIINDINGKEEEVKMENNINVFGSINDKKEEVKLENNINIINNSNDKREEMKEKNYINIINNINDKKEEIKEKNNINVIRDINDKKEEIKNGKNEINLKNEIYDMKEIKQNENEDIIEKNDKIILKEIKPTNSVIPGFDFKFNLEQRIKAGKGNIIPKKIVFKKKFKNDGDIKYSSIGSQNYDFYKKKGYLSATPRNVKTKVAKNLDEDNNNHKGKNQNCLIF